MRKLDGSHRSRRTKTGRKLFGKHIRMFPFHEINDNVFFYNMSFVYYIHHFFFQERQLRFQTSITKY